MDLPPGLLHIFSQTHLYTDEREYVMVSAPPESLYEATALLAKAAEPFSAVVVDKEEVTLALPREVWAPRREQLPDAQETSGYRMIGFDLPLELGLVGYIATLTDVLAEAGVSLLLFSAYQRDHILVPEVDFDLAWDTLYTFITACRQKEQQRE